MAPTSPKIVLTISSRHAAGSCLSSSVSSSISFELARRAGVFTNPLFLRPKRPARDLAHGWYAAARVGGVATGDGLLGAWSRRWRLRATSPQSRAIFFGTARGSGSFSSPCCAPSGGWVARWKRTVAVISYHVASGESQRAHWQHVHFALKLVSYTPLAHRPDEPPRLQFGTAVTINERGLLSELRALAFCSRLARELVFGSPGERHGSTLSRRQEQGSLSRRGRGRCSLPRRRRIVWAKAGLRTAVSFALDASVWAKWALAGASTTGARKA